MLLYRITNAKYANDLSGNGARLYGGRWNSEGRAMIYLASSRSLAVQESHAHLSQTNLPDDIFMLIIEVADDFMEVNIKTFPDNWNEYPEPNFLKQMGNSFLQKNEHLLLKVPSAIVKEESNYLMNPLHPKAMEVKIISKSLFLFDRRLIP
ncbi:MAG: hypothetical protein JWR54_3118 [Mucilaginibacter sp.]|nr:hypothetical protein [Mucilaginibacter sp.]